MIFMDGIVSTASKNMLQPLGYDSGPHRHLDTGSYEFWLVVGTENVD